MNLSVWIIGCAYSSTCLLGRCSLDVSGVVQDCGTMTVDDDTLFPPMFFAQYSVVMCVVAGGSRTWRQSMLQRRYWSCAHR
jgi:hypothetical protein